MAIKVSMEEFEKDLNAFEEEVKDNEKILMGKKGWKKEFIKILESHPILEPYIDESTVERGLDQTFKMCYELRFIMDLPECNPDEIGYIEYKIILW